MHARTLACAFLALLALAFPRPEARAAQGAPPGPQAQDGLDEALGDLRARLEEARQVAAAGDGARASRLLLELAGELAALAPPLSHAGADELAYEVGRVAQRAELDAPALLAWAWLAERWRATRARDDAELDRLLASLARAAQRGHDPVFARSLYEELLGRLEPRLAEDDPTLLALTRDLIEVLIELGEDDAASERLEAFHAMQSALLAEDHPDLLAARERLASLRFRRGDHAGAVVLFRRLLEAIEPARSPGDEIVQATRGNLLHALYAQGDLAAALLEEERAVLSFEISGGRDSAHLRGARRSLAGTLFGLGDLRRARRVMEAVVEEQARSQAGEELALAESRLNLAEILRRMGLAEQALVHDEAALAALGAEIDGSAEQLGWLRSAALRSLAESALDLGQGERAHDVLVRALDLGVRSLEDELELRAALADALRVRGLVERERGLRQETLAGASAVPGRRGPAQVAPQLALGELLLRTGELGEAQRVAELALAEIESIGPPHATQRRDAQALLARVAARAGEGGRLERALEGLARGISQALASSADPATPAIRGRDRVELLAADLATLVELARLAPEPGAHLARAFELLETRRARLLFGRSGSPLGIDELRGRLGGATVLAYHVLSVPRVKGFEPRLFGFRLDASGLRALDLGAVNGLEAELAAWRAAAQAPSSGDSREAALAALRARLVEPLLAPAPAAGRPEDGGGEQGGKGEHGEQGEERGEAAVDTPARPPAARLFVVPDDVLHGLPLAALAGEGARTLIALAPPSGRSARPDSPEVALIGERDPAGPLFAAGSGLAAALGVEPRVLSGPGLNLVALARVLRGARLAQIDLPVLQAEAELSARSSSRLARPAGLGRPRPERPEGLAPLDLASLGLPDRPAQVDSTGRRGDRLEGRDLVGLPLGTLELVVLTRAPAGGEQPPDGVARSAADARSAALALGGLRAALHGTDAGLLGSSGGLYGSSGGGARAVLAPLLPGDPAVRGEFLAAFYAALASGLEPHAALRAARAARPGGEDWVLSETL